MASWPRVANQEAAADADKTRGMATELSLAEPGHSRSRSRRRRAAAVPWPGRWRGADRDGMLW